MTAQPHKILLQGSPVGGTLVLFIYGDIMEDAFFDGAVSARSIAEILSEHPNVAGIEVRINSVGGSAFDGIAIHSVLKQHPAPVAVFVDGIAASAASLVAMAGDTISMGAASQMMIHNARTHTHGDKNELRGTADMLSSIDDQGASLYAAVTGKKHEDVLTLMEAETWFNAAEAVAEGFATDVVESLEIAASLDLSTYGFKNVPAMVMAQRQAPPQITAPPKALGESDMPNKILAQAAGLEETADDAQIAVKIASLSAGAADATKARAELKATQEQLSTLTAAIGEEGDTALGTIAALKESHAKLADNTAELKVIAEKAIEDEKVALMKAARDDGRLTADGEKFAKTCSLEALKGYLSSLGKVVPIAKNHTPPAKEGTSAVPNPGGYSHDGKAYAEMSGPEKVAFKAADPTQFQLAHRAVMDALRSA